MDDKGRHLSVSDQFNNCIRVFDAEETVCGSCGRKGYWHPDINSTMYDNFLLPASVCIDNDPDLLAIWLIGQSRCSRSGNDAWVCRGAGVVQETSEEGGLWMPFYIYARNGEVLPDCTYNVVNLFRYTTTSQRKAGPMSAQE
ncbi:MAG: hypothetical protein IPH35_18945 [Rhodoferax sp.]|nr:hypothetical protein [Rhodoferax sp.]